MSDIVKRPTVREISPHAQRVLRNMVESATTPSKSYKVVAANGGFVVYRPDLRAARLCLLDVRTGPEKSTG